MINDNIFNSTNTTDNNSIINNLLYPKNYNPDVVESNGTWQKVKYRLERFFTKQSDYPGFKVKVVDEEEYIIPPLPFRKSSQLVDRLAENKLLNRFGTLAGHPSTVQCVINNAHSHMYRKAIHN